MTVLAIDPGPEQSAFVLWDDERVLRHGKANNTGLLEEIAEGFFAFNAEHLLLEEIASYGMPVGREVFQTVRWAGRFEQCAALSGWGPHQIHYLPRREVKLHLCHSARANDATIRQALIDRFGGKDNAIGKKSAPGPLYGVKADEWQALALAVTFHDQQQQQAVAG